MGSFRFFRRKELGFTPKVERAWQAVEPVNYDAFLYTPVAEGLWQQHEVWDGTYTLEDLLDAHEMLAIRAENDKRARDWAEMEREMR